MRVSNPGKQDAILGEGNANMRHEDAEMLAALRQSLDDLEKVKLISPDDLQVLALKASLRQKIAEIQKTAAKQRRSA